jgi:hypothetical protein
MTMPRGWVPAATVGWACAESSPLSGSTENCETVPDAIWLVTYALAPSPLTTMPDGRVPAATAAGSFGVSAPAAPTSYCEMLPSVRFVTYAREPSGLSATCDAPRPAGAVEDRVRAPAASAL